MPNPPGRCHGNKVLNCVMWSWFLTFMKWKKKRMPIFRLVSCESSDAILFGQADFGGVVCTRNMSWVEERRRGLTPIRGGKPRKRRTWWAEAKFQPCPYLAASDHNETYVRMFHLNPFDSKYIRGYKSGRNDMWPQQLLINVASSLSRYQW